MPNSNQQPNSKARRRLKLFLLARDGDGETVDCPCGCGPLTIETATIDRHPVMGVDGGTYRRDNTRLACLSYNSSHGSQEMHRRRGHSPRSPGSIAPRPTTEKDDGL